MFRLLLLKMVVTQIIDTGYSSAWYLEARPQFWYIPPGRGLTTTCYNISGTSVTLPYNSRWYKIVASNGILQQLSTNINDRVRSDGSQLRLSPAINEDNGTYCCKGPMQALDRCDESAKANVIIVMSPVIVARQNQTAFVGSNATVECIIENVGNPPFVVHRWQKNKQRLVADGIKYSSQLIRNRMFLTIINSTTDDEGYYQCVIETSNFEIKQAPVYLSVNHTRIVHTGSANVSLPITTYTLQLHGQREIPVGMNLTIHCMVMASGSPVEAIQVCLALPTGDVIIDRQFNTIATLEHNGTYSCIALLNGVPTVSTLPVTVYAAPQPTFHYDTMTVCYGSNVTLPCAIDVANPSPSYYWERVSVGDSPLEINQTLSDGSLHLKDIQRSGIYQCTARNDYGSSIQIIELMVMFTIRNHSLELVGKLLTSPCDQDEHPSELSTLLQEHVTNICSCGDITVTVTTASCTDQTAMYSVQLTGVMATEAALLLITNIQNLTEGLDLGIVTLFLQEDDSSLESSCKDEKITFQSEISITIIILSVIIIVLVLLILLLASVVYLRKKITNNIKKKATKESEEETIKESRKHITKPPTTPYYSTITAYTPSPHKKPDATPYYTTMTSPCNPTTSPHKTPDTSLYITMISCHNQYGQVQHHNTPTTAPIKRSTSDNCLHFYEKIYPQHQKDENNYENLKPNTQVELHHK